MERARERETGRGGGEERENPQEDGKTGRFLGFTRATETAAPARASRIPRPSCLPLLPVSSLCSSPRPLPVSRLSSRARSRSEVGYSSAVASAAGGGSGGGAASAGATSGATQERSRSSTTSICLIESSRLLLLIPSVSIV